MVNVRAGKRQEVEYEQPVWLQPIPEAVEAAAQAVVDDYRESCQIFASLGVIPASADHTLAVQILAMAEAARASRLPFLAEHGVGPKDLGSSKPRTELKDERNLCKPTSMAAKTLSDLAKEE